MHGQTFRVAGNIKAMLLVTGFWVVNGGFASVLETAATERYMTFWTERAAASQLKFLRFWSRSSGSYLQRIQEEKSLGKNLADVIMGPFIMTDLYSSACIYF